MYDNVLYQAQALSLYLLNLFYILRPALFLNHWMGIFWFLKGFCFPFYILYLNNFS